MTLEVDIHEAKTHLSRLLQRVMAGEEVIIAKSGVPVAQIIPITTGKSKRTAGSAKGKVWIAPDFDELPNEELLQSLDGKP
jgi:prevent-host-death family protein